MSSSKTPVTLKPTPGFCVKTSTLQPAIYSPLNRPQPPPNSLDPRIAPIPIPKGLKIFINIAWDPNVPPPPEGSEDVIQRAMVGDDVDELNLDGWYVPVVVSEGRQDKDKAGHPCLVFDCVFNTSIKSRAFKDSEFRVFIIELALQRLEAQTHLLLSRQLGTPNLASKGKLSSRTVFIPSFLSLSHSDANPTATPTPNPNLIQEITIPLPTPTRTDSDSGYTGTKLKGILKTGQRSDSDKSPRNANTAANIAPMKPTWSWAKQDGRLQIMIRVPRLTHTLIPLSTLDLEPRRLILHIPFPASYTLDINLNLSDAEIVAAASNITSAPASDSNTSITTTVGSSIFSSTISSEEEPENALTLKRQRDFDVDAAKAEWRVAEGVLVVVA